MDEAPASKTTIQLPPWRFADAFVSTLVINLLSLAMPLALLQVYDRILPNQSYGTAGVMIAGVGTAVLLEAALRYGRSHLLGSIGASYEHRAGVAAFRHLLSSRIESFEQVGPGILAERFNALQGVRDFYSGQAILTLFDLPFAAVYLVLMWYIGHWLVAVPLGLLVVFFVLTVALGDALSRAVDRQIAADEARQGFLVGVLGGLHSVKVMALEAGLLRRYEPLQQERALANAALDQRSAAMLNQGNALAQLATIGVVALGAQQVLDGVLTTGGLAACTMLAGRALQPLNNAVGFWTRFQSIRAARRRFEGIFALPVERTPRRTAPAGINAEPLALTGQFSLRDVAFAFDPRDGSPENPLLLEGIDLEVPAGAAIAITGANGAGKSVLLTLIAGIGVPTAGRVTFDGRDAADIDPVALRSQIVLLPQKEAIFRGTILDNLTMFRPELGSRAAAAAKAMGIDEQIDALPFGFRTQVGEGAPTQLPRGLAQRIAIARGLVNRPRIVLFDEANSAVDDAGDRHLKTTLRRLKGHCTLVIVSHRPSILRMADRLYHLQDGRLEAEVLDTESLR